MMLDYQPLSTIGFHSCDREVGLRVLLNEDGAKAYPSSFITSRLHIQICVRNLMCIKGFFLPRPLTRYNPHFQA